MKFGGRIVTDAFTAARCAPIGQTYLMNCEPIALPIPENAFFKQAVFQQDFGQRLLELAGLSPEVLDLVRSRLTRRIAREPLFARLQELLGPTVIQVLIDAFLAA